MGKYYHSGRSVRAVWSVVQFVPAFRRFGGPQGVRPGSHRTETWSPEPGSRAWATSEPGHRRETPLV